MKPLYIATILALIITGCTLKKQVAFTPMRMLVVYVGFENPIQLNCTADSVTATNATVKAAGKNQYYVVANNTPGKTCSLTAWKRGKVIGIAEYRIKKMPTPIAQVGGKANEKVRIADFRWTKGINPILENFDFDIAFTIAGFDVTHIYKTGSQSYHCNGFAFSQDIVYKVENAQPGNVFLFSNIKAVQRPTNDTINLKGFFIEITE